MLDLFYIIYIATGNFWRVMGEQNEASFAKVAELVHCCLVRRIQELDSRGRLIDCLVQSIDDPSTWTVPIIEKSFLEYWLSILKLFLKNCFVRKSIFTNYSKPNPLE